ncbi:hypothetical protein A2U01_0079838, partial [Trifolium medium]|nr:hypothetical protein [Trifolium medium]
QKRDLSLSEIKRELASIGRFSGHVDAANRSSTGSSLSEGFVA